MENSTKKEQRFKNKMFDKIERCKLDLQKDPTNPKLHLRLADLYMQWHLDIFNAGQYIDDAITEYQIALESLIDSCEIYYKLGVAFYYKGELDKAFNYLTSALEKKNKYYQAYYMLAELFVKKAHFTDALDAVRDNIVICIDIFKTSKLYTHIIKKGCSIIDCSDDWSKNRSLVRADNNECVEKCKVGYLYFYKYKCYKIWKYNSRYTL